MQENKMVETVFRFVTVRNPKKVAANIDGTHHLILDRSTDFRNRLETASEEGDTAGRNVRLKNEATAYAASGGEGLFTSIEALEREILLDFLAFSDWLSANKATLEKTQVSIEIANVREGLTRDLSDRLMDNLMYYAVVGQANNITQTIQELLRADKFFTDYKETMDSETLKKMANAEVILPKKIFMVSESTAEATVEEVPESIDTVQLNQDINAHTAAILEL